MEGNTLYGQPMINALLELRSNIDQGKEMKVSGAFLDATIKKEVGMLISNILRNSELGSIDGIDSTPVRGFQFPDLEGFTLSTLVNEEWLTPQSVLAMLFAWSAKRDLRGMTDLPQSS